MKTKRNMKMRRKYCGKTKAIICRACEITIAYLAPNEKLTGDPLCIDCTGKIELESGYKVRHLRPRITQTLQLFWRAILK